MSVRGYRCPKPENAPIPFTKHIRDAGVVKNQKKVSILEETAKRSKTPGVGAYSNTTHVTWNAKNMTTKSNTKFSNVKRISMTEEIMLSKANTPGPNKYKLKNIGLGKLPGAYMKEPPRVSFLDEAMIDSKLVPPMNKYE
jgi:hypothetical protein